MPNEKSLEQYRLEVETELRNILQYWMQYTIDITNGGFVGRIDSNNKIDATAPKGAVLNARILWTFAAAYSQTKQQKYLAIADRAYQYLLDYFIDKEQGGIYWSVNYKGEPLDTRKQIYALAFLQYACSEYYVATQLSSAREFSGSSQTGSDFSQTLLEFSQLRTVSSKPGLESSPISQPWLESLPISQPWLVSPPTTNSIPSPKDLSISLYKLIEQYSFDKNKGGYFEAFTKDWKPIEDRRLSAKDANEQKTMNTHLHVLESYTNLYRIWPDESLKNSIRLLLGNFTQHIFNTKTHHLHLFFDEDWVSKSDIISYGHDIEAAWLLQEAAEVIHDEALIQQTKKLAVQLADATEKGLDKDGGLWYEKEHGNLIQQKHWWPQAEAMVGFFNAWQISGNEKYLLHSINSWQYTKYKIVDTKNGEWFWGMDENGVPMKGEDKAGIWKCPYHNARACMEVMKRIEITKQVHTDAVEQL